MGSHKVPFSAYLNTPQALQDATTGDMAMETRLGVQQQRLLILKRCVAGRTVGRGEGIGRVRAVASGLPPCRRPGLRGALRMSRKRVRCLRSPQYSIRHARPSAHTGVLVSPDTHSSSIRLVLTTSPATARHPAALRARAAHHGVHDALERLEEHQRVGGLPLNP